MDMCILDLGKTLMNHFHYKYVKKKSGDKAKHLFADADSLTYEIEAEDVHQDFWNDKKTNSTIAITPKTPHIMIRLIRRSLVSLKMKQLVLP